MSPLKVATPFVVVAVAVLGVAPAGLTVAGTSTPPWLTGFPFASRSWTPGCWANGTPPCGVADGGGGGGASGVAARAVMVRVPDPTPATRGGERRRGRPPFAPRSGSPVKPPTPLPSVVAVSVPPSVPAPVAIAAVTVPPAWLTALPLASRSCTTGCWANGTPFCAVTDGGVVSVAWVAAPALIGAGPPTTARRP